MYRRILVILSIISIAIADFSAMVKPETEARIIINKMLKAMESHKGCTFTMRSSERQVRSDKMRSEDIFTKVNVSPFKVYMKIMSEPNKGTEILYSEGERNNKALVNAGKFLPNLKLSPFNGLLTKNEHHSMLTSGFGIVNDIIKAAVKRTDQQCKFDRTFLYSGDVVWNSRKCYKIIIDDSDWSWTTYIAIKGENMYSIARKLLIPEYSMMEMDGIKDFDEDLGGKTLKIPATYARKTIFYIDKANNFPVYQEMADDKGIFERYEYFNLIVNPAFEANEFSEDFTGYSF